MSEILFLSHRIPYPPNKGDKIRSWHWLRGLAERFRVHLGTFVDDPEDWQHLPLLREICGEVCVRPLSPPLARFRSLSGFLSGRPLTMAYYRDRALMAWLRRLAAERPLASVFAYSSSMAPYVDAVAAWRGLPRIIDLCDVDSDKWRQYSTAKGSALSWIYSREARLLERWEAHCAESFDAAVVVAESEARLMRRIAPGSTHRIRVLANGVDTAYFDPALPYDDPFPTDCATIVFTGAMDYTPNVDAVSWFAREILPAVRKEVSTARFCIVGSNPSLPVRSLGHLDGVTVTGRVPDVRPYLARASLVVAPLRIARGVQNKVLEALAMARPIVATPNAVQGIQNVTRAELTVAEGEAAFAEAVVGGLRAEVSAVPAAREFAKRFYGWNSQVETLARWLDGNLRQRPAVQPEVSAVTSTLLGEHR